MAITSLICRFGCALSKQLKRKQEKRRFDGVLFVFRCGNQACGRFRNQHALHHYKTPHSDSHALCVNTTTWIVWCYECDDEVNVTARKKLVETVEHLRKLADSDKKKQGTDRSLALPSLGDRVSC